MIPFTSVSELGEVLESPRERGVCQLMNHGRQTPTRGHACCIPL